MQAEAWLQSDDELVNEAELSEDEEETATAPKEVCPCITGACDCRTPVERRAWAPPEVPEGYTIQNIKVKFHEDFDVKAAAEDWFNPDYPILVAKHTRGAAGKPHWHLHGAVGNHRHNGQKKIWNFTNGQRRRYPHPLDKDHKDHKPYSAGNPEKWRLQPLETGYQYVLKPRESGSGCIIHYHKGFGPGDLYQVYEQSKEYDEKHQLSWAETKQAFIEKTLFDAKHLTAEQAYWTFYRALFKYLRGQDSPKPTYNVRRETTMWIGDKHPGGLEYIYAKGY